VVRVVSYVHPHRTLFQTTGVGKHIVNMILGLESRPGCSVHLLAARNHLVHGQMPTESMLRNLPVTSIPFSRAWLEWSWNILHRPRVDRWSGPCDWIYSPMETFVPSRHARLAVTIHDAVPLETDLPWSNTAWARRDRKIFYRRVRPICKYADLILTVSEFSAERISSLLGVPRKKIVVVGNGVEDAFFGPAKQDLPDNLQPNRPYVLMVGGLDERKGSGVVFKIAEAIQSSGSDLQIAIAGFMSDELRRECEKNSNVGVLGYVDTEWLPGLLQKSVALLFPSRYEGFGIPVLEAMAAGTPAVISKFTALPEIAGDAAIFVDIDQPQRIADTLVTLSKDDSARQSWIKRGQVRAERFRWRYCVDRLANALS
jgi:glycosyltransferase involved in cell wall biosynthesis